MRRIADSVSPSRDSRAMTIATNVISKNELALHNNSTSCWLAIYGVVYDLTAFLSDHPGGRKILLKYAGKDATAAFEEVHNESIINGYLPYECTKGRLGDADSHESKVAKQKETMQNQIVQWEHERRHNPPLEHILNCFDMEAVAGKVMGKKGWDYYSSGADDEMTLRENHTAFHRIWLRPRILRDVSKISLTTTLLGTVSKLPIYITATALGKLAHPEGEVNLTRAAGSRGVIQMMPTLSSCSMQDMLDAKLPNQTQWFQLYVNQNRDIVQRLVEQAENGGATVLCITVDAPQLGRRERDMRNGFDIAKGASLQKSGETKAKKTDQGAATALTSFIDSSLTWTDVEWIRSLTKMKIILKGVQCEEDAVLAAKRGIDGVILSNHGGRQIDFARSAIEILPEVVSALKAIGSPMQVFIDGGIRRGNDIFKALALGATAVGIGRPAIYGMAAYGQRGTEHVLDMLRDELINTMRNMGAPSIQDIVPGMVVARNLTDHYGSQPESVLARDVYKPLLTASALQSRM